MGSYMQGGGRARRGFKTCPPICHSCVNAEEREGKRRETEKKGREEEGAFHVGTNWQKVHN